MKTEAKASGSRLELPSEIEIRKAANRLKAKIASEKYAGVPVRASTESETHPVITPFVMAMENKGYTVEKGKRGTVKTELCSGCGGDSSMVFYFGNVPVRACAFCRQ